MTEIPTEIKTREDAEKVVRILFRKMMDGTIYYCVQLVAPYYCKKCGEATIEWRDMHQIPAVDGTKAKLKEARAKAVQARRNTIDMLVMNTVVSEKEIKG